MAAPVPGMPAVNGRGIDPQQENNRRDRLEVKGEGKRQGDRDGRTKAGQHADDEAENDAADEQRKRYRLGKLADGLGDNVKSREHSRPPLRELNVQDLGEDEIDDTGHHQ